MEVETQILEELKKINAHLAQISSNLKKFDAKSDQVAKLPDSDSIASEVRRKIESARRKAETEMMEVGLAHKKF